MKRNIVNIVHFIRWTDARCPELDLFEPMAEQIRLAKKYHFKADFLLQYDTLLDSKYTDYLKKEQDGSLEIGGWFEIVAQQTKDAGIVWRGRPGYSWDWHSHVGFLVGYTQEERKKLIDIYMDQFFTIFGYYPKAVGSWFIDAWSINYMAEKYRVKAICICRDQWGTDGYNLWGGYFNAYYPSRKNMFAPAQSGSEQINVPVFRMLGSDPIYQYDLGMSRDTYEPSPIQGVCTMEPVYPDCGGNPDWVRWFYRENFNDLAQPIGYLQAGQENSFGWEKMDEPLQMQWGILSEQVKDRRVVVEHLSESGEWFRKNYRLTPSETMVSVSDWAVNNARSAWYCSRFYRVNIYSEQGSLWIRDIHLFDQQYKERYLETPCTEQKCIYDNLPFVDGYRWSGNGVRAGLYLFIQNNAAEWNTVRSVKIDFARKEDTLSIIYQSTDLDLEIVCREAGLLIRAKQAACPWKLHFQCGKEHLVSPVFSQEKIKMQHNGFCYSVSAEQGLVQPNDDGTFDIMPSHSAIQLRMNDSESKCQNTLL